MVHLFGGWPFPEYSLRVAAQFCIGVVDIAGLHSLSCSMYFVEARLEPLGVFSVAGTCWG